MDFLLGAAASMGAALFSNPFEAFKHYTYKLNFILFSIKYIFTGC